MEALWDAKNGPVESSPSNFIRQLLQSTSNPVDTEPFSADWKNAVGICLAFVVSRRDPKNVNSGTCKRCIIFIFSFFTTFTAVFHGRRLKRKREKIRIT